MATFCRTEDCAMPSRPPLITEIKGNSLDDGPGIRSIVFFKGCPLSCAWCHNPKSRLPGYEFSFDSDLCISCGTCIQNCAEHAISPENPNYIDRAFCTHFFKCADLCPSGALSSVGCFLAVEEIIENILKDKQFFSASGGGPPCPEGNQQCLFPSPGICQLH